LKTTLKQNDRNINTFESIILMSIIDRSL